MVSIVMAVYNTEKYLKEAIDSMLNQTYTNFEFIIINDGSTDSSLEIIESYKDNRILLMNQTNSGLSTALNNGIKSARGKYIARMDADDISLSYRLEKQTNFLDNNPNIIAVGSSADILDEKGTYLYTRMMETDSQKIKKNILNGMFTFHSSSMFRKDIFEKIGGYDETIKNQFEDKILWYKLAQCGDLTNITEPLIKYRLVPSSISNKTKKDFFILVPIYYKIVNNQVLNTEDLKIISSYEIKINKRKKKANYYYNLGVIYLEHRNERIQSIKYLIKSLVHDLSNIHIYFQLFLNLLPYKFIHFWKTRNKTN